MKKFFLIIIAAFGEVIEDGWFSGIEYVMADDLISFYAFCSIILSEIAFLWIKPIEYSIPLTVILSLFMLNLFITALGKICISLEFHVIGRIAYTVLFIIGMCINPACVVYMIIPFIYTYLAMFLREYQCVGFSHMIHLSKLEKAFVNFTSTGSGKLLTYIISPILPLLLFICFILINPNLNILLKILFIGLYVLITPFLAVIEDSWCTQNFHELFFVSLEPSDTVEETKQITREDAEQSINDYQNMINDGKKTIDFEYYKKNNCK